MDQWQKAPALPLWEKLEEIRAAKGWTWVQLARAAGVDRTTIAKWRTQPRPPHPPTVKQAAKGLGIDRQEAMWLAGVVPGPDELREDELRYQEALRDQTDQQQREVAADDDARDARDRVVRAMEDDPDLAIALLHLLARVGGGPPPAARAERAYRDEEGGAA